MARKNKSEKPSALKIEPIRGIVLDVTGVELMARIAERIAWHRRHGEEAAAHLKDLQAAQQAAGLPEWQCRMEFKELRQKTREHEERGRFLSFVRDHLSRTATYRLGGSELRLMEIMPESVHWL
jgi:hypothetical protein